MSTISKFGLALVAAAFVTAPAVAGQFTVESGKSKPLRLKEDAASIVVGNPNVADVAVHNGKLLFVSGKSFGTTNLMIFNKAGNLLYSADVVVTTNTANLVTVNRAGSSFTYDCAPECRPSVSIGDDEEHFGRSVGQIKQQQQLSD